MSVPAALFLDLDNTLYDYHSAAARAHAALFAHAARSSGRSEAQVQSCYASVRALLPYELAAESGTELRRLRMRELARRLSLPPAMTGPLLNTYVETLLSGVRWYAGAERAFEALAHRHPVVVITENFGDVAEQIAARLGITASAGHLLATRKHAVAKQDGSAYRLALQWRSLAPAQAVMIGDNWELDVLPAATEGIPQIWKSEVAPPTAPPAGYLGAVAGLADVLGLLAGATV